jgi:ribosomal-protein-alanine N-acetyltransferase
MKLRDVTLDDAEFLFEIKQDKEFQKYFLDVLIPKTLEDQEKEIKEVNKFVKKGLWKYYILEDKGEKIGYTDVYKINAKHKRCAIGYGIKKEFWGKGYATKALEMTLKEIYKLNIHTVEGSTDPGNISSQKVMEKNGFEKIGLMKDYYYSNNKYVDRILYWKVLE